MQSRRLAASMLTDIVRKSFATSPDGERFLDLNQVNQERYSEVIVFADNWLEMVRRESLD